MGLLNRLALKGKKSTAEHNRITKLRNDADAQKHADFNAQLEAEYERKMAEYLKKKAK